MLIIDCATPGAISFELFAREQRLQAQADELTALFGADMAEAGQRIANRQRRHALGKERIEVHRDEPAHREPDQMRLARAEVVEHALEVAGEIMEVERPLVIVAHSVAARVP